MKSFNLRLMSAYRMDGALCSSIQWPSEDSRGLFGMEHPLSPSLFETPYLGPCRWGGNSSLDGLGVTRILSSRWCLVKLEGKQCETLPPPVQHSTTAFITTFSMTSHHTPGSGLHGRECGERPPMWPIIR